MKMLFLTIFILALGKSLSAQTVENANVYPSNLEENMYFERFDSNTNTVTGLYFMVLSDGNNSRHVTPAFEVSLYLLPAGSSSADDLIIVKKYPLDGIYHMGSHEFSNETVNLEETAGIQPGTYRLGIWVNSNQNFDEDASDNATLFKNPITITKETTGSAKNSESPSIWDDDDDDDWDEDDDW